MKKKILANAIKMLQSSTHFNNSRPRETKANLRFHVAFLSISLFLSCNEGSKVVAFSEDFDRAVAIKRPTIRIISQGSQSEPVENIPPDVQRM